MSKNFLFILILLISLSSCTASEKQSEKKNMKANHLINEQSPYLLQHAYNPVDWYPWGDEAFEKAKKEDKAIFLSIGYSTCHWCHVMEHESFEDSTVAAMMNEKFICIKVDREERPDIDAIYMDVCQIMTGSGGWPLTIVMTPEKKPFFAGTYFPKESRYGRVGLKDLITKLSDAWKTDRKKILETTEKISDYFTQKSMQISDTDFDMNNFEKAFKSFEQRYDIRNGGFGTSPKFPSPHNLVYLLRYSHFYKSNKSSDMVENTLSKMRLGGVYDHIGYGYHRYSTDKQWLLPHFEKMLYDQALITMALTETYLKTKDDKYKQNALEILEYVSRDMTDKDGGFYSAEDADSDGVEGKFYVWEISEINELLSKEDAEFFIGVFNLRDDGNYKEEAVGHGAGGNIPHLLSSHKEIMTEYNLSEKEFNSKLEKIRKTLFSKREKRIHPYKDDKILTDWNGLMIAAYAQAGKSFGNQDLINKAEKAFAFIDKNLLADDGSLLHRYRQGNAGITGTIDDYAYMTWGLLELYEATFNIEYLKKAILLSDHSIEKFWDKKDGGFYFANEDATDLITRKKELYDGARPSGNSVQLYNLIRLGKITANLKYSKIADKLIRTFAEQVKQSPNAFSMFNSAALMALKESYEIVVVGDLKSKETQDVLRALNQEYLPNKVIVHKPDSDDAEIIKYAAYTKLQYAISDKTTIYVCKNYSCENPTNDIKQMLKYLGIEK